MLKSSKLGLIKKLGPFSFVPPVFYAPVPLVTNPCHYIVNYYVEIWHMRLGDANYRHPLSWGEGGGTNRKDPKTYSTVCRFLCIIQV